MDSYVCKLIVLENKDQRVLKPKKIDDSNRFIKASATKKCLFGIASLSETEKMLQEQYEHDKRRFNEKFGFDIQAIEQLENCTGNNENIDVYTVNGPSQSSKKCDKVRRIIKGKRRVFKPHNGNQAIITDFYQTRKNVQSNKLAKDSKEN